MQSRSTGPNHAGTDTGDVAVPVTSSTPQTPPRVFVSYAHQDDLHMDWVKRLALDLRSNGVDALLDKWETQLGTDLPLFMDQGIRGSERVLLVCTPRYASRANDPKGGVGYERVIVTSELARQIDTEKFICVVREGEPDDSIPSFIGKRVYTDFRNDDDYEIRLEELLRDILKAPADPKPPVGPNPFGDPDPKIRVSVQPSSSKSEPRPALGPNPFRPVEKIIERIVERAIRKPLPDSAGAITHRFNVAGHEGHITVSLYDNGLPGQVFVSLAKDSSTTGALARGIAKAVTIGLQHGIPLEVFVAAYAHERFEPSGMTFNPDIPFANSLTDYLFRWLAMEFIPGYRAANAPKRMRPEKGTDTVSG